MECAAVPDRLSSEPAEPAPARSYLSPSSVLGESGRRDLLDTLESAAIVSVTSADGTILEVNRRFCEVSGYSREELVGHNHRLVNSGTHPTAFWADMYRTVAAGGVWRAEVRNRAKDGSIYWVDSTMKGFFGPDGRLSHIVSVRTDITALKAALDELAAARDQAQTALKAKSEFLANISHELRTPLTAVLGYADLLMENGDTSKAPLERLDCIQTIKRTGQHLLTVINDVLDLSKIEAGSMTVESIACSPARMLDEVRDFMQGRARAAGLDFRVCADGPVPDAVITDPTRLRQILLNLLGNAIKFTPAGSVRLTARATPIDADPANVRLEFDVEDTGLGIEPRAAEALFQPFSQADSSMSRRFGGSGLGLSISRRLAQMLGGGVTLVRTAPGRGSLFRLEFPCRLADSAEFERPTLALVQPDERGPLTARILLAEDGPDNQRLIAHLLRKAGAEVNVAANGKLALDAALSAEALGTPFDLILMDMQMPEMDGYTATAKLREAAYPRPIIALTAHALPEERQRCLNAGCDHYESKPIEKARLIAVCRRWAEAGSGRPAGDAGIAAAA